MTAHIDDNHVSVGLGASDAGGTLPLSIDAVTGRLLVEIAGVTSDSGSLVQNRASKDDNHANTMTGLADNVIDTPLINDYLAFYPFNGNAKDSSVNGLNGTVSGATATLATDRNSNTNTAYTFANTGDKIFVADTTGKTNFTNTQSYSIAFWFNTSTGGNTDQSPTEHWETGGYPWSIRGPGYGSGKMLFLLYDGVNNPQVSNSHQNWADGNWHFLVARKNAITKKMYLTIDSNTNSTTYGALNNTQSNSQGFCIGNRSIAGGGTHIFHGTIDSFIIFNRFLSDAETASIYADSQNLLAVAVDSATTFPIVDLVIE